MSITALEQRIAYLRWLLPNQSGSTRRILLAQLNKALAEYDEELGDMPGFSGSHIEPSATLPVDVAWVDDNDGCGPRKLSNSVRVY